MFLFFFDPTLDQWLAVANKPLPGFIQTFYSFTSYGIDLFQSYGVSDLKISKIDATGTDNTELLTDLNVISLQLLDGITIRFNVKTVTEQSTYFYYTVENSTFNRVLEFNQSIPVADKTIPIYYVSSTINYIIIKSLSDCFSK